ncbi:hypothetical protein Q4519_10935 [Motilimonas sp. 1_MG-2023]|uniref:hypothetical protein n=1 Tax=Motilimonas sp. 1_MG-2023 TaxID=3062672 RepID=UPI0026E2FAC3|nr:hypothetical protein [Motilimonas sp. 1_MG-2023]MDO6526196.1 hypothetical protein [Motilimonas sp. 1_MG-2023]
MSGQSLVNDVVSKPLPRVTDKDSTIDIHKTQQTGKASRKNKKHLKTQQKLPKHPDKVESTTEKSHEGDIDVFV